MRDRVHDLRQFFAKADAEIASDYERIRSKSRQDPGSAGDEGENVWQQLLKRWLPPSYHIAKKGQVIFPDGSLSPQVDLVVLKPGYPEGLRDIPTYLSDGVLAIFECKNTLNKGEILKTVDNCRKTKALFGRGTGSPYKEIVNPVFYGLLAMGHAWKSKPDQVVEHVNNLIYEAEADTLFPDQLIDAVLISGLASWGRSFMIMGGPPPNCGQETERLHFHTSLMFTTKDLNVGLQLENLTFSPVGNFVHYITKRFAHLDRLYVDFSRYYSRVITSGVYSGRYRVWPGSYFSPAVQEKLVAGVQIDHAEREEWGPGFF